MTRIPRRTTVDTSPVVPPSPATPAAGEGTQDREDERTPDPRSSLPGSRHLGSGNPSPLPPSGAHPVSPGAHQADAGRPDPVTRAAHLPSGSAARGRGRTPDPAGGMVDADATPPAGSTPRSYMLVLPPGLKLLNLNDRTHWAARHRRSQALKKAAWAMALQAKIPVLERVVIVIEYQPPDRRWRDPDNVAPSAKALIDGCVAAGCLVNDDSRYVAEVTCRIGQPYPKGRLLLHLTEVGP